MLLGTSARPVGRRLLGASRTNFFSLHLVQQRTYARRIYITLRVYDSSLKLKLINIILSLVIVITFTTLLRLISLSAQERESEPLRALALRGAICPWWRLSIRLVMPTACTTGRSEEAGSQDAQLPCYMYILIHRNRRMCVATGLWPRCALSAEPNKNACGGGSAATMHMTFHMRIQRMMQLDARRAAGRPASCVVRGHHPSASTCPCPPC